MAAGGASTMRVAAAAEEKKAKLWGGRFEEGVTDAVERFSESVSFDKALYKHDIAGSVVAHPGMLAARGLISDADRDSILFGLKEIKEQMEAGEFLWRTDREDVHMNIEASLTDMIGEPAKKLHTARSRNDQVVTDLRLWCRDAIDEIVARVKHIQLERDAGRFLDCHRRLNLSPLGACALAGTGLPIDRLMTAKGLGFTAPMRK